MSYGGTTCAVSDVTLDIGRGESVALLGPSGAGKSTVGLAMMGLLPAPAVISGEVIVHGVDMCRAAERDRAPIRGWRVAHMGQSPSAALNPARRIGDQVAEAMALRHRWGRSARVRFARTRLAEVGLDGSMVDAWPHELSGGQMRRAAFAMALATDPDVLIADEPTVDLDTVRRNEIARLLAEASRRRGLSLVVITHDVALACALCDSMAVLLEGRVVERAPTRPVTSRHPYVRSVLEAVVGTLDRVEREGPAHVHERAPAGEGD